MKPAIIYLHGFCSAPQSWKAVHLEKILKERGLQDHFYCPALSPVPDKAIEQIKEIVEDHPKATLVGSSLGGFYATWFTEQYKLKSVLINPAVLSGLSLDRFLGTQTNFYTNESFEFTEDHAKQLKEIECNNITPDQYLVLLATGDEVLDYKKALDFYDNTSQVIIEGDNHSFTSFPDFVDQIIEFSGL